LISGLEAYEHNFAEIPLLISLHSMTSLGRYVACCAFGVSTFTLRVVEVTKVPKKRKYQWQDTWNLQDILVFL